MKTWFLRALSALLLIVVLIVGGIGLRLSYAPIPLDFARASVEKALPVIDEGLQWQISGVDLAWVGWHRGIRIRARGARLLQTDGSPVLTLPIVGVRMALRPLLHGEVRLSALEIVRPRLRLVRDPGGELSLGMSSAKAPTGPTGSLEADDLLEQVLSHPDAYLQHISIREAQIVIADEKIGAGWFVDRGNIEISPGADGIRGSIDATVTVDQHQLGIHAQVQIGNRSPYPLQIAVDVPELPVSTLQTLWPVAAAASARQWIVDNIRTGHASGAHLELDGQIAGGPAGGSFTVQRLDGTFDLTDVTVRYLDPMPAVAGIRARTTVTLDGFDFAIASGNLATTAVGPGRVRITGLSTGQPRIAIDTGVRGGLSETLTILDSPPLRLARAMKIDPKTVGGAMDAKVRFDFAIDGRISGSRLGLGASGKLTGVSLPKAMNDWNVSDGNLEIKADDRQVEVKGTARVAGVPVDGRWLERLSGGDLQRTLSFKGMTTREGRKALGFDAEWIDGSIPASVQLSQGWKGEPVLEIRADLTHASLSGSLGLHKPAGEPSSVSGRVTLRNGSIDTIESIRFQAKQTRIQGKAVQQGGRWSDLQASGELHGAPFHFTVKPGRPRQSFTLHSADAGAFARALDLYADGEDGTLDASGTVDLSVPEIPFDANLEVRRFTATKAPTITKILSMASFSGIERVMTDKGIRFRRITANLTGNRSLLEVRDAAAAGKSLSIILSGKADRLKDRIDFSGTLAPDYYGLNRFLNRVPLLGRILTDNGTGVFAVGFTIRGPYGKPDVGIDPVRTLTPGLIRQLGRLFEQEPPPDKGTSAPSNGATATR